ncbi:fatty-acid amide hydrolase 2-A-like [Homalodisca vitripennis]|uniref:fatty-acid amide hydrolase 2-A-like n=1 Tax=Homalodisca vitripennis TaxID=197043 RepID=UPI001EEA6462|nr:fatty-acid amide hydrolase 2-A-like [Homalodisca vitripennis]XP_046674524.1 fatty-acid amide hydrolase 2-A-like [Homalodisca vitripennis]
MWGRLAKWVVWLLVWSMRLTVWPYSRILSFFRKKTPLPAIDNNLLLHSATSLAEKIRNREIGCEDVVQAYIARIKAVNPELNCVVQDRFEQALQEARKVDLQLAAGTMTEERMREERPLLGVPITVKESIALKGMSHNSGRVKPKQRVATEDASFVRRLKEAGCIPLLVSNTPEVCMCWETFNNVTGRTNNPYDARRTPGGSSGGEAALLGAGASVIGLASDIGGSGRLPALYCGVYGHKPTPGYIGIDGHIPVSEDESWGNFFSIAPMCRYAEDLPLYLHSISDPSKRENLRLKQPVDLKTIKIFYIEEDPSILADRVHPEIKTSMRKAVAHFANKFNIIAQEIKIKELEEVYQVAGVVMLRMKSCNSVYQKTEDNPAEWNSVLWTYIKYIFGFTEHTHPPLIYGPIKKYADSISDKEFSEMLELKRTLMQKFDEMLGDDGVFLYPTFNDLANYHQQFYYKLLNTSYFTLFNLIELPACSCPTGLAKDGRPVGFQVAANKHQDRLVFAVAKELESAFGGWVPPPSIPTQEKETAPNPKQTLDKVTIQG